MCDRSGTNSGLIREDTSGNTTSHSHKHASNHTAGKCGRVKCSYKDHLKYMWNFVCIQYNYSDCKDDIEYCHEWNQLLCYGTDTFYSAK